MENNQTYLTYSPPKSNSFGNFVKNINHSFIIILNSIADNFNFLKNHNLNFILEYQNDQQKEEAQKFVEFLVDFLKKENLNNYVLTENHSKISLKCTGDVIHKLVLFLENHEDVSNTFILNVNNSIHFDFDESEFVKGDITCCRFFEQLSVRQNITVPFPLEDEKSIDWIKNYNTSLPFKLNVKHFRYLGLKNGKHGSWKLDETKIDVINKVLKV